MVISLRTPEGEPNECPVCRKGVVMEPSQPFGDAPCPHCGCLLRFEPAAAGFRVSAPKRPAAEGRPQSVYLCPGCKTEIPFGTKQNPPPDRCPVCWRRLSVPSIPAEFPGLLASS